MKRKPYFLAVVAMVLLLSSCASRKEIAYFEDMLQDQGYPYDAKYEATVHANDRLSIVVSCRKPELAIPFNTHANSIQVGADGRVSTSTIAAQERTSKGYRVDVDGNIEFPILGTLHVEGLRVSQVTDMIKKKIEEGNYIKDPQVSLEFLNFRYTVLGAVGHCGTFTVNDDRVTILDAIANAGDLSANAKLNSVAVIRESNGERRLYVHDIRSKDIFTSPCFYLQQNDIVYVEPKKKNRDRENRVFQIGGIVLSVASVVASMLWVFKK